VARVTVIVPVYDDERHLPQALESVLAQTYGDWEAIVVDDASTDGTPAVAAAFAERDSRIRVLRMPTNVGVPIARNRGIAASGQSDLIALLDSDDYWLDNYLERTVALYDAAREAGRRPGIVACDAFIHGPHGVTGERWSERFWWRDKVDYTSMLKRNYVLARVLFSRAAYDSVGEFAPECAVRDGGRYAASDDFDLWMRMIEADYEVVTTREPLAVYRYSANGRSRAPRVVAEAALVAYDRVRDRGVLDWRQRRAAAAQIRHYRALRLRAGFREALAERRWLEALAFGARAVPYTAIAFLQAPSRWSEWLHLAHAAK
jgi:teichuronic acid biosynthesis glycosyltransferase TuaG